MERTNPKRSAHQKLSTLNPGTIKVVSSINRALIIKVKRPRVNTLIGRVKRSSRGFSVMLITPKTKAVTKATTKLATWTPGRR